MTCWDDAQAALCTFRQKLGPDEDEKKAIQILEQVFENPKTAPETWGSQSPTIKEVMSMIERTSIYVGIGSRYSYHGVNH